MSTGTLRPLVESDLEILLQWRNSESVRRFMYSKHRISREEHVQWFDRASKDSARHPMMFELDGSPRGFVNIGPVLDGGVANWGFYAAPDAPRGTGRQLSQAGVQYAFEVLGIHKLCGSVLAGNEASKRCHLNAGFRQEGLLAEHHHDGARYHDVLLFGLLRADWQERLKGRGGEASS